MLFASCRGTGVSVGWSALGLIELSSTARGLVTCDEMVKRAQVRVLRATSIHPGKYLIIVSGGVDEVNESLRRGQKSAGDVFVDVLNLPNPHSDLLATIDDARDLASASIGIIECYLLHPLFAQLMRL